ncbi:hypothetical protein KR018_000774, partial [Drosophila ironensis]
MSLKKKDPSLRVVASDPHLVSLGGGRLSTAVTLHYIHIGDTSIGSAPNCSISLKGSGIRLLHCTIYRSDSNEVTLVPEKDCRLLIDGTLIVDETKLSQGAMITIGNSNYLRFNNPDEAQMMRSAMGSNERMSMPQIDFSKPERKGHNLSQSLELESLYESIINPINNSSSYEMDCPKVFPSDLVTVSMPAKDVLGQKYASFARNLAENNQSEKQLNNQFTNRFSGINGYWNFSGNAAILKDKQKQQSRQLKQSDLLTKVNNDCYDRHPKLGGLQIYSMNGENSEINNGDIVVKNISDVDLEDMLKICTEYADRNNATTPLHNTSGTSSITSSPIVQNRIKTNGSLPRDKNKSPFLQQGTGIGACSIINQAMPNSSFGYDNVRLLAPNRVEFNGQIHVPAKLGGSGGGDTALPNPGVSENVSMPALRSSLENLVSYTSSVISPGPSIGSGPGPGGKYVPQSPRTKIRTNCMSPKKDVSFGSAFALAINSAPQKFSASSSSPLTIKPPAPNQQKDYEQLFKSFERKQMQLIRLAPPKRTKKNLNNLTLSLQPPEVQTQAQSPKIIRKPTPASRSLQIEQGRRKELIQRRNQLKKELAELNISSGCERLELELEPVSPLLQLQALQKKIRRQEAQRNATRVIEENQQAKLKQSIEIRQDQLKKLRGMLEQKPNNTCLKEELQLVCESLESDRKTFEDLEFQYFEEESEHHASHEELKRQEHRLTLETELAALQISSDEGESTPPNSPGLNNHGNKNFARGVMSQSLFGSAELLCPKQLNQENKMSKSVNENMFYNHKIEIKSNNSMSIPIQQFEDNNLNLSLQNDCFEGNPLEHRVPSQDDFDRSCKVAKDAPISTSQCASTKIFDSIKEIERNRKLLLTQQGHQVIEHERQKMCDLKKKSHDEARIQYMLSIQQLQLSLEHLETTAEGSSDSSSLNIRLYNEETGPNAELNRDSHATLKTFTLKMTLKTLAFKASEAKESRKNNSIQAASPSPQRHSHPELELNAVAMGFGCASDGASMGFSFTKLATSTPRPLSEANNCEVTIEATKFCDGIDVPSLLANRRTSSPSNSQDTASAGSGSGGSTTSDRKRILLKHQRPLTRYLPIFSPDLNLRHHIETAGHQIDLCPHVFVDAHSCRGNLHKLGSTFHTWSRRWFVLDRQRSALIYYSDKSERKPRGGAYFA